MAIEVVMPRLGWTMETGIVGTWVKRDGETVRAGEVLFTVETDKVAQEVEATGAGILRIAPDAPAGAAVPVGTVLAYLVEPDEAPPFEGRPTTVGANGQHGEDVAGASPSASIAVPRTETASGGNGHATPAASPRARRVARELGVDWTTLAGSGRTGRIVERDVRAAAARPAAPARVRVTPLARRVARRAGVDLAELTAQRPGQRIVRADIEAAASGDGSERRSSPDAAAGPTSSAAGRVRPLGTVRRTIAARLAESAHTVAPVTLTTEADATELVALRNRIKGGLAGSSRPMPSYTDLLARLVALALLEHPWMNCSLAGETIVEHEAVHIGIAVDTEQGLLVPVVRDAQALSVERIAAASARLIARARAGKATPDELRGSTFTITNLGMYEIDAFTPIINLPECAILGVGRIVARPVVIDEEREEVAVRRVIALSLTFDHRLVDGAPAARFLQQIKRWVEQPYAWITA